MSDVQTELERLLKAEREACERAERVNSVRSTVTDRRVREAAQKVCDQTKEALERFIRQHPGHGWLGIFRNRRGIRGGA
jgi:hypothetical protein